MHAHTFAHTHILSLSLIHFLLLCAICVQELEERPMTDEELARFLDATRDHALRNEHIRPFLPQSIYWPDFLVAARSFFETIGSYHKPLSPDPVERPRW